MHTLRVCLRITCAHADRRTALRETWMAAAPDSVIVKFVLYEKERNIDVQKESDQFHDIIFVQGGTTTDYRSIVYKTFAFVQVSIGCNKRTVFMLLCVYQLCTILLQTNFPCCGSDKVNEYASTDALLYVSFCKHNLAMHLLLQTLTTHCSLPSTVCILECYAPLTRGRQAY